MNSGNTRSSGRAAPIGSLIIQPDGRSKFYPDGGRDRPPTSRYTLRDGRRSTRRPSPVGREMDEDPRSGPKKPPGTQAVYYNAFPKEFDSYSMDSTVRRPPGDDDEQYEPYNPSPPPPQATLRSCMIFSCVTFVVILVIALAVIFPVIYVASTSSAPCNLSCANGGTLNGDICSCTCPSGFNGTTCDNVI